VNYNKVDAFLIMCFVEVIASVISAISVLALLFAILRNPKVRSNTFNLYLAFCLAPDAVYSPLMTWITVNFLVLKIKLRATGQLPAPLMLDILNNFFIWSENFWFCASLWMSFSVFVQIYKLLTANKRTKRYQPPTRKRVIRDSTIILIISGIVAASITLWRVYYNEDTWGYRALILTWTSFIPTLYIPTLLITGMCFGVWWDKLLPRKNTRYRSLAMFFARLLASTYLMVGGAVTKLLLNLFEPDGNNATKYFLWYTYCIYYLFGFFQVCLALSKKDIRGAFVEMWCCCRKHDNCVTRLGTFFGRLTRTTRDSYGPEDDGYDVDPPNVNDAASSAVNPTVLNLDNHHPNENDGNEANTTFVESTEQNYGTIVGDIDEGKIGENCSVIDEISNEIAMSKGGKDSEQNYGTIVGDIDEGKIGENCSVIDEISNEIAMSKGDKDSVQV